jgi:uncharacterized protein YkwD
LKRAVVNLQRTLTGAVFAALTALTAHAAPPADRSVDERAAQLIVEHTNRLRHASGLGPVQRDEKLTAAAHDFARHMARTERYGHEADGRQPSDRVRARGYAACLVAENIAYEYRSSGFRAEELARRVHEGWRESPGHRRNMLDADATEIGVAIVQSGSSGRHYAVQLFGRPETLQTRFEIENRSGANIEYRIGDRRYAVAPRVVRTHEQCRDESVQFELPGATVLRRLEPSAGKRYVVERARGGFQVLVV